MGNTFANLNVPAGDGSGMPLDCSSYGKVKTIIAENLGGNQTVMIEISNDVAGTEGFTPVARFQQDGVATPEFSARWMRATVSGFVAGVATPASVRVGFEDVPNQFAVIPVPAGNGAGAPVDISTFGAFKTIAADKLQGNQTVEIQISNDPGGLAGFFPIARFEQPGTENATVTARWMRAFVSNFQTGATAAEIEIGAVEDTALALLATWNIWTRAQGVAQVNLTDAVAGIATDARLGNVFYTELGAVAGNTRQLDNPSSLVAGFTYIWCFQQPAAPTALQALTYDTMFKFPGGVVPVLTAANDAVDTIATVAIDLNPTGPPNMVLLDVSQLNFPA